ncbi:hypothetical protein FDP41_012940 [Naegleria fowleri]|uniref:HP domain-containing protein n=1 Tax=Naegleria fowleri TaxID=5763 RepID=A0A6A5C321_NAEFO|nr:uncharacterized protein FDP41_012940 [Naegleria fowleri]KAF0981152.1 hypothetical protein FDP41_012940 [Naegleria fowleri]
MMAKTNHDRSSSAPSSPRNSLIPPPDDTIDNYSSKPSPQLTQHSIHPNDQSHNEQVKSQKPSKVRERVQQLNSRNASFSNTHPMKRTPPSSANNTRLTSDQSHKKTSFNRSLTRLTPFSPSNPSDKKNFTPNPLLLPPPPPPPQQQLQDQHDQQPLVRSTTDISSSYEYLLHSSSGDPPKDKITKGTTLLTNVTTPHTSSHNNNNSQTLVSEKEDFVHMQSSQPVNVDRNLSSKNSQIPTQTRKNRKNRSKSKQQLFDEVFEQLEQLDELYFDNMVSEDEYEEMSYRNSSLSLNNNHNSLARPITNDDERRLYLSHSPVIQFENLELNREFLARHERTHSLMSREEYEQKREWICKQYIEATSSLNEEDEDHDDFSHPLMDDFHDEKTLSLPEESSKNNSDQLIKESTPQQAMTVSQLRPSSIHLSHFQNSSELSTSINENSSKTTKLYPSQISPSPTFPKHSSLSQPSLLPISSTHTSTMNNNLPPISTKIQTSHSKVGKKLTTILNMLSDAQQHHSQSSTMMIPSSVTTHHFANSKILMNRTSMDSNEEDVSSFAHSNQVMHDNNLKGNRHSSSTLSNYTSSSTSTTAMDRTSVDASSESGNISNTSHHHYLDPTIYKFSYLELKDKFPKGVKQNEKEKYLSDEEFFKVFEMNRREFEELNITRKRRLKIEKGLF